ncbi:MAG: rRNA maturation RNase YbeY [Bacteroidales bacterium]|nr:rRNA maturation RNase YbeY [Bacteroidales bacterium]MBN2699201.1 rRNA maturation RNase YbeY [Bacteroidales bacterium]
MAIFFHNEGIQFDLKRKREYKNWINKVISYRDLKPGDINIIFTSAPRLLQINRDFLKHNYDTDVITFDYSEYGIISGDVFVGLEQVKKNSIIFGNDFEMELSRVMIHGILHLMGYRDATDGEKEKMHEMEEWALKLQDQGIS